MDLRSYMKIGILSAILVSFVSGANLTCSYQCLKWNPMKPVVLSPRQMMVKTIYGVNIVVDSTDGLISGQIRQKGSWQPENLRTFGRFVKEGDTVLNVGAHIGLQAIILGKVAGSTGKLFIFQPYKVSYKIIMENVYLNDLQGITTVYNLGAGNEKFNGYILVNVGNPSGSMVFNDQSFKAYTGDDQGLIGFLNTWKKQSISIDLVDNVLPADVKVNFALIDVERLQIQVLEGMKRVIQNSPDMIMAVEWSGITISKDGKNYETKAKALIDWLAEKKYKFYIIQRPSDPSTCEDDKFIEMNVDQVMQKSRQLAKGKIYIDMIMAPSHLNPNDLH